MNTIGISTTTMMLITCTTMPTFSKVVVLIPNSKCVSLARHFSTTRQSTTGITESVTKKVIRTNHDRKSPSHYSHNTSANDG